MKSLQHYLTAHTNQTAFDIRMGRERKTFDQPMGRQMTLMGMTIFPDSADRPSVYRVQPGSPAAKAGVKKGDVVTSVGHQTTDTMTKFMNMTIPLVKALNPGTGVPFAVMRNGNPVKVSIARPSDSDLQPLTPSDSAVLDRQGGVISTATQEPERPQQQPMPKRRNRNNQNGGQQRNANSASGEMPIAAAGQIPNQQQNSQNGLNGGGVGLGLDGGGFLGGVGGTTGTTGTTGTGTTGTGTNGSTNAVVAALYGTAQNQSGSQSGSTSSQGNNNRRSRNNFTNSGVVGYVTIQSSVPLSQSANGSNGSMGTTGTGTTGTGTTERPAPAQPASAQRARGRAGSERVESEPARRLEWVRRAVWGRALRIRAEPRAESVAAALVAVQAAHEREGGRSGCGRSQSRNGQHGDAPGRQSSDRQHG